MGDWGPQACGAHTHLLSALSPCCTHLPRAWGLAQDRHSTNVCLVNKLHLLSHHHKFVYPIQSVQTDLFRDTHLGCQQSSG